MDLESTVRDLAPRLLRFCRVRMGDRDLARDVAQESLTALATRWRVHGPPASPEAFVFAIARRRAARLSARQRLLAPIESLLGRRDGRPDPESAAILHSERARVREALTTLSRRERDALLLVAVGELTMAEAAAALGISVSAVKMRTARARARLARLLENDHDLSR